MKVRTKRHREVSFPSHPFCTVSFHPVSVPRFLSPTSHPHLRPLFSLVSCFSFCFFLHKSPDTHVFSYTPFFSYTEDSTLPFAHWKSFHIVEISMYILNVMHLAWHLWSIVVMWVRIKHTTPLRRALPIRLHLCAPPQPSSHILTPRGNSSLEFCVNHIFDFW